MSQQHTQNRTQPPPTNHSWIEKVNPQYYRKNRTPDGKKIPSGEADQNCGDCSYAIADVLLGNTAPDKVRRANPKAKNVISTRPFVDTSDRIIRSYISDEKFIKLAGHSTIGHKNPKDRENPPSPGEVSEQDAKRSQERIKLIYLEKSTFADINRHLQEFPSRRNGLVDPIRSTPAKIVYKPYCEPGSLCGCIILTLKGHKYGHILNFYVSPKNEVFYFDGQSGEVFKTLPKDKFEDYVYYTYFLPTDGFQLLKQEPDVAPVSSSAMPMEPELSSAPMTALTPQSMPAAPSQPKEIKVKQEPIEENEIQHEVTFSRKILARRKNRLAQDSKTNSSSSDVLSSSLGPTQSAPLSPPPLEPAATISTSSSSSSVPVARSSPPLAIPGILDFNRELRRLIFERTPAQVKQHLDEHPHLIRHIKYNVDYTGKKQTYKSLEECAVIELGPEVLAQLLQDSPIISPPQAKNLLALACMQQNSPETLKILLKKFRRDAIKTGNNNQNMIFSNFLEIINAHSPRNLTEKRTALHLAAFYKNPEFVKILLDSRADPYVRDNNEQLPEDVVFDFNDPDRRIHTQIKSLLQKERARREKPALRSTDWRPLTSLGDFAVSSLSAPSTFPGPSPSSSDSSSLSSSWASGPRPLSYAGIAAAHEAQSTQQRAVLQPGPLASSAFLAARPSFYLKPTRQPQTPHTIPFRTTDSTSSSTYGRLPAALASPGPGPLSQSADLTGRTMAPKPRPYITSFMRVICTRDPQQVKLALAQKPDLTERDSFGNLASYHAAERLGSTHPLTLEIRRQELSAFSHSILPPAPSSSSSSSSFLPPRPVAPRGPVPSAASAPGSQPPSEEAPAQSRQPRGQQ